MPPVGLPENDAAESRLYYVRGRVQGVGFRSFVQSAGTRLGLTGWTRNLDDGRVEAFAQGPVEQLREFEGLLWKGPRWSDVRGVTVEQAAPVRLTGFAVRH